MDPVARFRRLFDYNLWANRTVLDTLSGLSAPIPDATRWIAHVLWAERVWYSRLPDSTLDDTAVRSESALDHFRAVADENHALWTQFIAQLGAPSLDQPIPYTNLSGQPFNSSLNDIITHVVNHGTHHRAQIQHVVRQSGVTPVGIDFILWARR